MAPSAEAWEALQAAALAGCIAGAVPLDKLGELGNLRDATLARSAS